MNLLQRILAGSLVSAASVFLVTPPAQATFIVSQYDQKDYPKNDLLDCLLNGAIDYLNATKNEADAQIVSTLFMPDDKGYSAGQKAFNELLELNRDWEKEHTVDKNGNIIHYQIESALNVVLKNAGVKTPLLKILVDLGDKFNDQRSAVSAVPATQPTLPIAAVSMVPSNP